MAAWEWAAAPEPAAMQAGGACFPVYNSVPKNVPSGVQLAPQSCLGLALGQCTWNLVCSTNTAPPPPHQLNQITKPFGWSFCTGSGPKAGQGTVLPACPLPLSLQTHMRQREGEMVSLSKRKWAPQATSSKSEQRKTKKANIYPSAERKEVGSVGT